MQNEITELRNQVRTLKRIVYGFGCLLVAGIVVGATSLQTVPDVITAKNFLVVDGDGKPIAALGKNPSGGGLIIYNKEGKPVVSLGATPSGGSFDISNKDGKIVAVISVDKDQDTGALVLLNAKGEVTSITPERPDEGCCQHPHHLECIVNTTSSPPGSCQHSHHLECGVTTIK